MLSATGRRGDLPLECALLSLGLVKPEAIHAMSTQDVTPSMTSLATISSADKPFAPWVVPATSVDTDTTFDINTPGQRRALEDVWLSALDKLAMGETDPLEIDRLRE